MNAIAPRGWCPGLYTPMASGDGLLVRIRPPRATLTVDAARALGLAASQFGNGVLELTSHAAIQVRGLTSDSIAPFATAMASAGLADADPEIERRRIVVVPPLADDVVLGVGSAIETCLGHLPPTPAKFAISVDSACSLPLGDVGADVRVFCSADCTVTLVSTGEQMTVPIPEAATAVARFASRPVMRRQPAPRIMKAIGLLDGAFGFGLPFGAMTTEMLAGLIDIAERDGDGTLRVTPWRAWVLPRVHSLGPGADLGFIVNTDDPRLAIIACPGRPGCSSSSVETRADAAVLAAAGLPATVHVSGCIKGCAHPAPARITLVGENGRYNLVRAGRASDPPVLRGKTLPQIIAALRP
jgi:precorrin-3B synthase